MKFIYATTPKDRDELVAMGYPLFKENKEKAYWVFIYDGKLSFTLPTDKFIFSDKMIFD